MKKLFEKPEIEIVSLDSIYDVIATSPVLDNNMDPGNVDPNEPGDTTEL